MPEKSREQLAVEASSMPYRYSEPVPIDIIQVLSTPRVLETEFHLEALPNILTSILTLNPLPALTEVMKASSGSFQEEAVRSLFSGIANLEKEKEVKNTDLSGVSALIGQISGLAQTAAPIISQVSGGVISAGGIAGSNQLMTKRGLITLPPGWTKKTLTRRGRFAGTREVAYKRYLTMTTAEQCAFHMGARAGKAQMRKFRRQRYWSNRFFGSRGTIQQSYFCRARNRNCPGGTCANCT